ncbi:hypothetical protein CapIbe_020654 [Capra ibex]
MSLPLTFDGQKHILLYLNSENRLQILMCMKPLGNELQCRFLKSTSKEADFEGLNWSSGICMVTTAPAQLPVSSSILITGALKPWHQRFQATCGILASQPGSEPMPPAVEARCLKHWTTSTGQGFL